MSGLGISIAEIERWSAESIREVFHAAQERAQAAFDVSGELGALHVFATWGGDAAAAAEKSIGRTRKDLAAHGNEAMAVAHAARTAADEIETLQARLRHLVTEAEGLGLTVDTATNTVDVTADAVGGPTAGLVNALTLQNELDGILYQADDIDDTLATAIDMADGDAPIPTIPGPAEHAETRLQNQIDAFADVFDRSPSSAADWDTAAVLDPHSYEQKNAGAAANIVVGRIKPVPGQGVVRANLFIPSEEVWLPDIPGGVSGHNFGDNRGFDPQAGPEQSRVSMYVDYENGLIVARQNPSVDTANGEARVGHPNVAATQRPDGTVFLRYDAVDPFFTGGEAIGRLTPWTVNGEIAIQPTPAGPRIGGDITSFPAVEIYRDPPGDATSTLAQIMPHNTSQAGPMVGLPLHQTIGDPALVQAFHHVTVVPQLGTVDMVPGLTTLGDPGKPAEIMGYK